MQDERPKGIPEGTIQIDPEEGFGPHITEAFLDLYGEYSVFAAATVDLLTWRFVGVLVKADKLPMDFEPPQYGPPEMRKALDGLLKALTAQGHENSVAALMRSALGRQPPQAFQIAAGTLLGNDLIVRWLQLLEQQDHAGATALLSGH